MPQTPLHLATLGFRGLKLDVQSNLADPLDWLQEFLSPWFGDVDQTTTQRTIRLLIDEERYSSLLSEAKAIPDQQIDCFTLDGAFARHQLWSDDSAGYLIHDSTAQMMLAIKPIGGEIELTARADHARMRVTFMRVARELASLHALHSGDLFLHGAAVVCDGRAIAIAGQKRAGKTSNLINALRQPRMRFLSNDRIFIAPGQNLPTARGMPTIINVRPNSLEYLPALAPPDFGFEYRHYLSMEECRRGSALMEPPKLIPPAMSATQFCRWLGVDPLPVAPLAGIIFPHVDTSITGFEVTRLTPAQGQDLLHTNLFSAGPSGPIPQAFARGWDSPAPTPASTLAACEKVVRHCRFLDCRIGPKAFGQPNVWEAIHSAFAQKTR